MSIVILLQIVMLLFNMEIAATYTFTLLVQAHIPGILGMAQLGKEHTPYIIMEVMEAIMLT